MEKFGFVGLPNAGKSSLYNALTGGSALAAPYAFATVEPNIGIAKVIDDRLQQLSEVSGSQKIVNATVQFADIGGLVKGAGQGEGMGNAFLSNIRDVDLIVYVLRAFEDEDVPGDNDPVEQLSILELELTIADLESLNKQIDKRRKMAKTDEEAATQLPVAEKALKFLEDGVPLYRAGLTLEEQQILKPMFMLTNKSVMAILNISEEDIGKSPEDISPEIVKKFLNIGDVIAICVQLEAEAAQLPEGERQELLDAYNLGEGALAQFLQKAYYLLGRRTFFTTGEKETRAWTFRQGYTMPECAGVIHTDLQRGFIQSDVINWKDLVDCGSWNESKNKGLLRQEGKAYVVEDGDVVEIRFNV